MTFTVTYFIRLIHFIFVRHGKTVVLVEYYSADIRGLLAMTSSKCFGERYWQVIEG
jgi:hypothetical protein